MTAAPLVNPNMTTPLDSIDGLGRPRSEQRSELVGRATCSIDSQEVATASADARSTCVAAASSDRRTKQ
ncbi:MAG: hypothetical protein ACHREM_09985 [Polyangiales bacterium]